VTATRVVAANANGWTVRPFAHKRLFVDLLFSNQLFSIHQGTYIGIGIITLRGYESNAFRGEYEVNQLHGLISINRVIMHETMIDR
jgi:hypothetical protein